MADFQAVEPGTDLSRHARELVRMHDAVIGGGRSPLRPRPVVARSWRRVMAAGLAPGARNARSLLGPAEMERRRRASPLRSVLPDLTAITGDTDQLMLVVSDADGVLLWRHGAAKVRSRADDLGFREGTDWTEAAVGTNAIGTALAEAAPVQLFSGEHFEQHQHPWYCTAAPIHDPRTGDLLGIVDISGPALTLHPAVSALVATSVRLAQAQLWRQHEERLARLRAGAAPLLAGARGPVLLVDDDGWVAHASGVAVPERVAAPDAARPLGVPGLGLCVAEQVAGGWLLRPEAGGAGIRLTLELTDPPAVAVHGAESSWRSALSVRHAEILLLLVRAGRAGLSVGELSRALYGDAEHAVAVRAEVSRLRRVLGAVLESRPYRIAETVVARVDLGGAERLADSAFLERASGPGVRALRTGH